MSAKTFHGIRRRADTWEDHMRGGANRVRVARELRFDVEARQRKA
jgi:hypothetical protein